MSESKTPRTDEIFKSVLDDIPSEQRKKVEQLEHDYIASQLECERLRDLAWKVKQETDCCCSDGVAVKSPCTKCMAEQLLSTPPSGESIDPMAGATPLNPDEKKSLTEFFMKQMEQGERVVPWSIVHEYLQAEKQSPKNYGRWVEAIKALESYAPDKSEAAG